MKTVNIIAHPEDDSEVEAIKAVLKALKIDFEITESEKKIILSKEQQQILDSQLHSVKSLYINAEQVYEDLKNKYEL